MGQVHDSPRAIPIALIVNIIRITVTGLLYLAVGPENEYVKHLGHDWAGYFMMPLALGFLWVELQFLERLTIPVETARLNRSAVEPRPCPFVDLPARMSNNCNEC